MPRRDGRAGIAGISGIRALLVAEWDQGMKRWRIPGHIYEYEEALKGGRPVVISTDRLLSAFTLAGLPANRFGFGGVDHGKWFRLNGDELCEWHGPADEEAVIDE
ncbi:hypothetical protein [Mycobacterium sp. URHD0025]|uniref:hypothetical protein n=1 Tax=Mycobacterium sp. URHD0025 TaxID=1298864 RepID=UPI000428C993|nr:hypothetical protein [Mycobacterium sp. URHD0025]